ncbi:hypothetical protein Dda_8592 [Drechslerella dactyloides]|uniref:BZIP domain-containing protein n=1 Tax=Drechslerella dactyloides TaxID=74499 RepID=A0AAD6ISD4_DREDA|nr:hypothetical protein Dda_8592 [Drechslerella dactyloides]
MLREAPAMSHTSYPPHSPASSSDSSSASGSDGERLLEDTRQMPPIFTNSDSAKSISLQPYNGVSHPQGSELPAASPTAHSPEQRASRPFDVSKMLNPTPSKVDGESLPGSASRRRNADEAELDTPQRISSTPQQPPFTRSLPPSPTDRYHASEMHESVSYGNFHRNIKHPVPPSSRQREGLPPMIDPHNPPLPPTIDTPPRRPTGPLASPTVASGVPVQQPGGFPFPPINGPHPSQGPHSQPSLATSPNSSPFSRHQQPVSQGYTQPSPVYPMNPPFHDGHSSQPMVHSTSQPSYQGLHLAALEGLAIPVDTTAASKLADEKRKRNAGASARFRQRRKEREREMSTRIVELETRLKVVEEERDHYRNLAMKYAGTPLPNTISTSLANVAPPNRHNNHGLQLSPRTMARANQQHLMNEGPYTSPAYAHVREEALGSPVVPLNRTLSTEGRRVGRAYSAGQVYPGGAPIGAPMGAVAMDGPDRPLDAYAMKSRNGSFHHPRPTPIPEHYSGRDPIKTEWVAR